MGRACLKTGRGVLAPIGTDSHAGLCNTPTAIMAALRSLSIYSYTAISTAQKHGAACAQGGSNLTTTCRRGKQVAECATLGDPCAWMTHVKS